MVHSSFSLGLGRETLSLDLKPGSYVEKTALHLAVTYYQEIPVSEMTYTV